MHVRRHILVSFASLAAFVMTGCGTAERQQAADSAVDAASGTTTAGDFRAPLGVQLWSFRALSGNLPEMLATIRGMGFTHVETAGLYGQSSAAFASELTKAGLKATSMHVSFEDLKNHPDSVIANAKALGAQYVGIAWYPHDSTGFTLANAKQAVKDFNGFGRVLKDAGLTFFYHNHGYEPVPHGDGTLLDLIIQETDPALVSFEMDVLWTWLPGQDPVALIGKYPGRFKLMHIKDMKPGLPRGSLAGGIADSLKAPIGAGQIDWPTLLRVAERDGLTEFFVEDETTDPVANAPTSIAYLRSLTYRP